MEATTNDLRSRTKDLLDTVNKGEEVVITYHGKPCAKLVPYLEARAESSGNELFRFWRQSLVANRILMTVSET